MGPGKIWHSRVPNLSIRKIKVKLTRTAILPGSGLFFCKNYKA